MSQLIITRSALMHIESKIGDGAECEMNITKDSLDLTVSFKNEIFVESIPYVEFFYSEKTSGQWLREFENNAVNFFMGTGK